MSGDIKKDIRSEARAFSSNLSNVFLLKRRDPQTKHLLEKAQQLIDGLLAETPRPVPATPPPRVSRGGGGMGQLWVKLDELKRENDDLKRQRARSSDEKAGSPKSPKSPKSHSSPGQVEALTSDLQRAKHEIETLKSQVEKLQKTVKEHQTVHSTLQDEYKRSKVALEAAQKSASKAREDTKKVEASLRSLRAENESLKQKPPQSSAHAAPTKPPISSPKPSPKSAKAKVRADNRLTENISERCRPSNIAVAYTTLESQEWMDAKESLEEFSDEEECVTRFLCDVLMNSYQVSRVVLQSAEKVVAHILAHPTTAVSLVENDQIESNAQLPDDVSDIICQRLRASFDKINTRDLAEMVKDSCDASSPLMSQWSNSAVQKYVHECGAVSWQMAIQKPPMKLSNRDTRFDDGKHKLWWSCDQAKARKIDYFIWPVLYDYDGGNLMVKGCVHAS